MQCKSLFQAIAQGATVLTPNRRLATWLRQQFDSQQSKLGKTTWPTPTVLPLLSWLQATWEQYELNSDKPLPCLLNEHQEITLWESLIKGSMLGQTLLSTTATANALRQSWQLIKQWQINLNTSDFSVTEEAKAFFNWAKQYQAYCSENRCIDHHSMVDMLINAWQQNDLTTPKQVIFACFEELSPQIKQLVHRLEACGSEISTFDQPITPQTIQLTGLASDDKELTAMASWAYQQLTAGVKSIACVVAQLSQLRSKVFRIFSTKFQSADQFNISLGKPLSEFPIVHTALQILQFNKPVLDINTCSYLLRSPFLGDADKEQHGRAKLETVLRASGYPFIDLNTVYQYASLASCQVPKLMQRLQNAFAYRKKPTQLPSEWAEYFCEQLRQVGWPGPRSLNSEEYQLHERWQTLLSQLATLDRLMCQIPLSQALAKLGQLAQRIIFQAQSQQAPIQVLGLLEAGGMQFDAMWIMGMDDDSFPPTPRPDPFIPKHIQQRLNLPHANAARELSYSKGLLNRLIQSTHKLVISYAHAREDALLRPSPLVSQLSGITITSLKEDPSAHLHIGKQALTQIKDPSGPPVREDEHIQGGSFILQTQAICPFRAFAKYRLHTPSAILDQIGLSRNIQGMLVHRSLQNFWDKTKDWHTLQSYDDSTLRQVINNSTDAAVASLQHAPLPPINQVFLTVERQRLVRLLTTWINEVERQRPPFTVIAHEYPLTMQLGGICFNMRIDRIDQYEDDIFIIDYKTHKTTIADWFGDRPDALQLPLYCLAKTETCAIVYGQLYRDELNYKGLAAKDYQIHGVKAITDDTYYLCQLPNRATNWQSQKSNWQKVLQTLAEDFCHGQAKVDPKYPQRTCNTCNLQPLCRIRN